MTVAIVTGASRGIGAVTASRLGDHGVDVVINFREKAARAERVADQIRAKGSGSLAVQADLTDPVSVDAMIESAVEAFGRLDLLVLNASGGLEKGMPADYAMRLNRDAQVQLADRAVQRMTAGGRIVFVTSHEAHFYGDHPTLPEYEPVAASKYAGEQALRARAATYAERGVALVVVSGDLIDGTITAKILDRVRPGLIDGRRAEAGYLPTVEEFADEIVAAALESEARELVLVGATR